MAALPLGALQRAGEVGPPRDSAGPPPETQPGPSSPSLSHLLLCANHVGSSGRDTGAHFVFPTAL